MKTIDLQAKNIYFIGIGGVSMSGLAHILHSMGYNIYGSDRQQSSQTSALEAIGATINYGHNASNITTNIDTIVYTAAIKQDNPEYAAAKNLGIPMLTRAELLGKIIATYKNSICIAGTHGKTTTTAMLSHLLLEQNLDPTISIGAFYQKINSNFRLGTSEYFIVESCEYSDSFLQFHPSVGVILNMEFDHPDHFSDLAHTQKSFATFASNVKDILIINEDIKDWQKIASATKAKVITFKESNYDQSTLANILGNHNKQNAVAALTVLTALGIATPPNPYATYSNPHRRLETKGTTANGALVIDDYAHHPTEIKETLHAIRQKFPDKNIITVFQPHTFTRTKGLLKDFATSFGDTDTLILLDIFAAREKDEIIHTKDLLALIKGIETHYFPSFEACENFLINLLSADDLLITMGASNVNLVGENLLKL